MSNPTQPRSGSGALVGGLVILATVAFFVAVGWAAGVTPEGLWNSFYPVHNERPVTDRGVATKELYDVVFAIAAVIFVAVEALIIYTVFRYRRRPSDTGLPPQTHGNTLVEVIWTAIPTAIVLFIFAMTWQTLNTVDARTPGDVNVRAIASRFQWQFDYLDRPDGPDAQVVFTQALPVGETGGLVLPVGEPVHISLTSPDVIHAFYVPKFLFKRDVVPGKVNTFDFTIDEPGTYRGQCAELCGAFHGSMVFEVRALPSAEYDAWLAAAIEQAAATPPPAPSGGTGPAIEIVAADIAFDTDSLSAPADTPFVIALKNDDDGVPHNVEIQDASGASVFKGDLVTGPAGISYEVPALGAGAYTFLCTVHPNMAGTLTVE